MHMHAETLETHAWSSSHSSDLIALRGDRPGTRRGSCGSASRRRSRTTLTRCAMRGRSARRSGSGASRSGEAVARDLSPHCRCFCLSGAATLRLCTPRWTGSGRRSSRRSSSCCEVELPATWWSVRGDSNARCGVATVESTRDSTAELLSAAYSTISTEDAARALGFAHQEELLACTCAQDPTNLLRCWFLTVSSILTVLADCASWQWEVDTDEQLVRPKTVANNRHVNTGLEQLETLSQYVLHLEQSTVVKLP